MILKFRIWHEALETYLDLSGLSPFHLTLGSDGSVVSVHSNRFKDSRVLRAEMFTDVRCYRSNKGIYLNDIVELWREYTGDIIYEKVRYEPSGIKGRVVWSDGRFIVMGPDHKSRILSDQPVVLVGNANETPL